MGGDAAGDDMEEVVGDLKDQLDVLKSVIKRKDAQIAKCEAFIKKLKESGQIKADDDPLAEATGSGDAPPDPERKPRPRPRNLDDALSPDGPEPPDVAKGGGFTAKDLKDKIDKAVKPYQEENTDLKKQLAELR